MPATSILKATNMSINWLQNDDHQSINKILKVELRKLDGDKEKWKSLAHWFTGTICNLEGSTDSIKLAYLYDTVTADTRETIAGFEDTNDNYLAAWNLLDLTYNNKWLITFRNFNLLMKITTKQDNSADFLRQLVSEV